MTQQIVFPYLGKSAHFLLFCACVMSFDRHNYFRDPFKKHRHRIHLHRRVASEKLIAEHPSLSLRSGDLLCVNCLKEVQKHYSEVAFEPTGPSSLSQECAVPTPYSSTQDSDSASDDSPGCPALCKINERFLHKRSPHSESDIFIVKSM